MLRRRKPTLAGKAIKNSSRVVSRETNPRQFAQNARKFRRDFLQEQLHLTQRTQEFLL